MEDPTPPILGGAPRRARVGSELLLVTAGYWAVARLGLSLPTLPGAVAPIWPPAGLALALVLLRGPRVLPAIGLGELLANAAGGTPLLAATGMAAGNTLEALAGLVLLRWALGPAPALHRVRDVLALTTVGAALATTVSATVGVLSLWAAGVIPSSAVTTSWQVWWVGDALGVLVITPLVLAWTRPAPHLDRAAGRAETVAALGLLAVASCAAFGGGSSYPSLVFPAVVWIAIRLDRRMAATGTLVVAAVAVVRTAQGAGAFASADAAHGLWHLDTYLAVVAVTGMVLGAVRSERDRVQCEMRDMNATLDERFRTRTAELAATAEAFIHQALHDALTGLPNRTLLLDRLEHALARQRRHSDPIAVLFLDLDRFKWVNDSLGHQAGDRLLDVVARRLTTCLRPEDTVARFGGDEFVVLCEDISESQACTLATRIATVIAQPVDLAGQEVTPHTSIGIALSRGPAPSATAESLLRDADIAMYRAKEAGGDRWEIFDATLRTSVRVRLETETELRRALERDELRLHYQPTIDVRSGSVIGVEALVRWEHPERGLLPPGVFVPVAEETGLIVPLGSAVMAMACREVGAWQSDERSLRDLVVAVNLSTRQLLDRGVVDLVRDQLDASGLHASCLCIEITESVVLGDVARAAAALHALKGLGVTIGLDDFGTGYSSLSYLQKLPIDVLKIDRSFVGGLGTEGADHALVASIIEMSHALGIRTIAEGVETEQQLAALSRLGCDHAQGFYWSRPLPPAHALDWVRAAVRDRTVPLAGAW